MIVMFAIQDVFSRFIIHACLKEAPKGKYSALGVVSWFKLDDCFKEAFNLRGKYPKYQWQSEFSTLGRPLELILDGQIYHVYENKLQNEVGYISSASKTKGKTLLTPLDSFFGRLIFEMRDDLTNKNLQRYVNYWNFKRKHTALNNHTPSEAFFSGDKRKFEFFSRLREGITFKDLPSLNNILN